VPEKSQWLLKDDYAGGGDDSVQAGPWRKRSVEVVVVEPAFRGLEVFTGRRRAGRRQ